MVTKLIFWLGLAILMLDSNTKVAPIISPVIKSEHVPQSSISVIAGPVDFSAYLVNESTIELSWNPMLLNGSEVDYFNIWDKHSLVAVTTENRWQIEGIDRNSHNDFAVSAVTLHGEETRRSSRIYYDLPQLIAGEPDGYNNDLPPLENLTAEIKNNKKVALKWDVPPAYWSWAKPSDYSYVIVVDNTYVDIIDEPYYTYTGIEGGGPMWIGVSAIVRNTLGSRQPHSVLVDTNNPIGTVSHGVTGYNALYGLRSEIYSSSAAELFWESNSSIAVSHVYINGRLIARLKEGRSLFMENLPAGERILVSIGEGWPYEPLPENRFFLSYDSPLIHSWIEMPGGNSQPSTPRAAPVTGLRSATYSASAAEVFWDRSDAPLARYRVYLNGEFVVETDAVSWYFNDLPENSQFTVGVVSVSSESNSVAAEIVQTSFTTFSRYRVLTADCAIKDLFSIVYSSTAAEVFWARDPSGPRYDLYLNDEFLIKTDATSWFFEGLTRGSTQQFQIVKSNAECATRSSVQFDLSTSGSSSWNSDSDKVDAIINRNNYSELVREVFQVYVGDFYITPLVQVSEFSIAGRNPDYSFIDVFDCEDGNLVQELDPTSTNAGVFFTFEFDQCLLDDETRNGFVSGQNGGRGLQFNTDQFSVSRVNGDYFKYSGYAQRWKTQTGFFDSIQSFDTNGFSVEATIAGVEMLLEQMDTSFAYGRDIDGLESAWLRGGFSASLGTLGGALLTINVPIDFVYALNTRTDGVSIDAIGAALVPVSQEQRGSWTFTEGQMEIKAEDGSTVQLDANTANPETVRVTISSERGIDMFDQDWSMWSNVLRFNN